RGAPACLVHSYEVQLEKARGAAVRPAGMPPVQATTGWWQQDVQFMKPPAERAAIRFWAIVGQIFAYILLGLAVGATLTTKPGQYVAKSIVRGLIYGQLRALAR